MFRNATEHYRQDQRTLQAFTSLLRLVEALASVTEQGAYTSGVETENGSPITLAAASRAFAEIVQQVLDCRYVAVIAFDPPDERQRLLGISGLSPEEEQQLYQDVNQKPLEGYVKEWVVAQLHSDQVVTLDLKQQPFLTPRGTYGARYRLVAPMMWQGQLIGIFTMAKGDHEGRRTIDDAYPPQERALAKGVARLATQVIERVSLLQERAEAKAKEQKLQEVTRRYEDCLSTASHELRTPLTTIKGNLQLSQRRLALLLKRIEPAPELVEGLRRSEQPLKEALQNFGRLERMIGELLDYSRIQADKFILHKQFCNLVTIAQKAVEEARKSMDGRTILLTLPEQEEIPVYADKDRIGEVIHNYLTNAHKYSSLTRPIEVSVSVEGTLARLAVRDEGCGIPPQEQGQVWERFYRVPNIGVVEPSAADSNLGLGLYLCWETIELHGGRVGVSSTPGQGSTFWFTLALAPTEKIADGL
jgi:signal transduction histidine kinase